MYHIVGSDQKEYGPVTAEQIITWIQEGRSNGQTLARHVEGAWKPLSTFPEFAPHLPPPAPLPQAAAMAAPQAGFSGPPPSYLVLAVLATTCCGCVPLGIPAVYHAAQAVAKIESGNIAGAWESSKKARMWCVIAIIGGAILAIIYATLIQMGYIANPNPKLK